MAVDGAGSRREGLDDLAAAMLRVFHESASGVALLRPDGRFIEVNDAFAALLGRTRAEVTAGSITDHLADPPSPAAGDLFGSFGVAPDRLEIPVRHVDGSVGWLGCTITRLDGPQPTVVLLGATDITRQRRLDAGARDSVTALHLLLEAAPDGIAVVDGDGTIRSVNPRLREMFGYGEGELEGQAIEVLVPERLRDVHSRYRSGFLRDPHTRPMGQGLDLTARRRDGTEFPVEIGLGSANGGAGPVVTCVITDIAPRKAAEAQLAYQATHDALTGLPNRALFLDRVAKALAHALRNGRSAAVLFIDLDRFKVVNDSLGHAAGDLVLAEVSRRLQAVVRSQDTAARFGGDEFAVLCTDLADDTDAVSVAARVLAALEEPIELTDRSIVISPSIGIAISPPDGADPQDLIRDADAAMYLAKHRGRARYEVFNDGVRARALQRLEIEQELRNALARGELRLVYQPVVSLETSSVVGMEALVRWQHPERGLVPPSEFIPLAEDTGLIGPIGLWVLREACAEMARLYQVHPGIAQLGMAVNLCPVQLRNEDLVGAVAQALEANSLPAGALTLEITESALGDDLPAVTRHLGQLEALGVSLAIDDFGTGYSSLMRLRQFDVDTIKIDGSFVAGINDDDGDDLSIVTAVIDLAHALGASTIAECVETPEQLDTLRRLGCDYAQGFHFSRPLAPSELLPALVGR